MLRGIFVRNTDNFPRHH